MEIGREHGHQAEQWLGYGAHVLWHLRQRVTPGPLRARWQDTVLRQAGIAVDGPVKVTIPVGTGVAQV